MAPPSRRTSPGRDLIAIAKMLPPLSSSMRRCFAPQHAHHFTKRRRSGRSRLNRRNFVQIALEEPEPKGRGRC